ADQPVRDGDRPEPRLGPPRSGLGRQGERQEDLGGVEEGVEGEQGRRDARRGGGAGVHPEQLDQVLGEAPTRQARDDDRRPSVPPPSKPSGPSPAAERHRSCLSLALRFPALSALISEAADSEPDTGK
ncbi:hypothetical protein THAOC_12057, partial [Thalassiosira oceanica]